MRIAHFWSPRQKRVRKDAEFDQQYLQFPHAVPLKGRLLQQQWKGRGIKDEKSLQLRTHLSEKIEIYKKKKYFPLILKNS